MSRLLPSIPWPLEYERRPREDPGHTLSMWPRGASVPAAYEGLLVDETRLVQDQVSLCLCLVPLQRGKVHKRISRVGGSATSCASRQRHDHRTSLFASHLYMSMWQHPPQVPARMRCAPAAAPRPWASCPDNRRCAAGLDPGREELQPLSHAPVYTAHETHNSGPILLAIPQTLAAFSMSPREDWLGPNAVVHICLRTYIAAGLPQCRAPDFVVTVHLAK